MNAKLHLGSIVIEPVTSVRNLGVYMDGELNMRVHTGTCGSIPEHAGPYRNMPVHIGTCGSILEHAGPYRYMRVHIGKISSACFYHLRRLRQLRNIMSSATMQRLVSAFVLSRLDYCISVLAGLPADTLKPLQRDLVREITSHHQCEICTGCRSFME